MEMNEMDMSITLTDTDRPRTQAGFTLVELLVIMAILAVLAGTAVFALGNLTDNVKESGCNVEKATLVTANASAKTKGSPHKPSKYLEADSVDLTTVPGEIHGTFWKLTDTPGGSPGASPVTAIGTLPAGCS